MIKETKLAEKLTIESVCDKRNEALVLVTAAMEKLQEAELIIKSVSRFGLEYRNVTFIGHTNAFNNIEMLKKQLDKKMWQSLIDLGRFEAIMTSSQKEALRKQVESAPELTHDTANATFKSLLAERPVMLKALVESVFDGRSRDHKSTSKNKIGKKHIIPNALSYWSSRQVGRLEDMIKALYIISGKKPDEHHAIHHLKREGDHDILDGKVSLKKFKNDNVHVIINDKKLLERINDVLAGIMPNNLGDF